MAKQRKTLGGARTLIPNPSPACGGREQNCADDYVPHPPALLPEDVRAYAREMRQGMTNAEALLWKLLRNRRVAEAKFRRQHPVGRYILDFYCDEKKLGVELDGGQHAETVEYDEKRSEWLRLQGIRILRFWNNQMLAETEAVMEAIYQALTDSESKTTKASLPQAGEGSEKTTLTERSNR